MLVWKRNGNENFFFVNRSPTLKEITNITKHVKKNKNYNEILQKPLIFNLQTVSTVHHRCPDVVGCRREVAEQVKKTTSVPETKKEELPMKLLDDLKIPIARRNPRRPYHSHKPLDVATEVGLKPGGLVARGAATTTKASPLQTLTLKTENGALKTGGGALPPTRADIHHASMAQKPKR
jgi:hypothetical protein